MSFAAMVKYFYPDAMEGVDFALERSNSGKIDITLWNEEKLGKLPDIKLLHSRYMEFIKRQKELLPKTDDADPAPWLNEVQETARISQNNALKIPVVDIDFQRGFVIQR
jgi:hypothetical protein